MKLIEGLDNLSEKTKHAERVLSQPSYDVIQIHLEKDEVISTHHAKEETLIIVRTGKARFVVEEETVVLTNEEILQMAPYEKHCLDDRKSTRLNSSHVASSNAVLW